MLSSSLREKRHYLAIEILAESSLSTEQAKKVILAAIKDFLGSSEAAVAGAQVIGLHTQREKKYGLFALRGILSVNRKKVMKCSAALALLSAIDGKKASCTVRGVSGTLRKLREKFLK